jgi:transcriptional antiterminator
VLSEEGITLAPEKVQKVLDFPLPKTIREMRSFIGLVNSLSSHIDNCSTHLLKPLQQMVTEATKTEYDNKVYKKMVHFLYGNKKSKSNKPVQWNQEREAAFKKVQQLANECPTLFFLTETELIFVRTDASDYGIGGYLYQKRGDGSE